MSRRGFYVNDYIKNLVDKVILVLWDRRKWFTKRRVIIIVAIIVALFLIHHFISSKPSTGELVVTAVKVEKKTVPVYLDYVGNTASVRNVDIRARVKGFLIERNFVEGDYVNEGDLMLVIDPREYEAALENAVAGLSKNEAAMAYANEQVVRYASLVEKDYVTQEYYDNLVTTAREAIASVEASRASVDKAELDLGYCSMYSPVTGRVGRTFVHVGNLVGANEETKLATVVQLDPIYIYFSPSDDDVYKILKEKAAGEPAVSLTFDKGDKYPYLGKMNFIDNEVNTTTSTVALRATMPNPDKTLLPGMYMNVRLHLKDRPDTLLAPEKAIEEDQGGQYVMAIEAGNIIKKIYVETGAAYEGMRVITKGVKVNDRVAVDALQLVRTGMQVAVKTEKPKKAVMKAGKGADLE